MRSTPLHVPPLWWRCLTAAGALSGVSPGTSPAQVVRGTITESPSLTPLVGVLVELLDPAGGALGSTLSDTGGRYAVRAQGAGRYVLAAKRIGVRRHLSPPFDLGAGETLVRDIVLDPVSVTLPTILVTGLASCPEAGVRDGRAGRIAALWEEARTALQATMLSLRDSLFTARVTRYLRELSPRTLRVVAEYRSDVRGVVSRPFGKADPESLSVLGHARPGPDGAVTYFGPDPEILLSPAFLRDHCFTEETDRGRQGLVGLRFRPVRDSGVVDILGTFWLDRSTSELRLVEFGYARPGEPARDLVGGELQFARLGNGAWMIRRWFIRLPGSARSAAPISTEPGGEAWTLLRPVDLPLREEGGEVVIAVGATPRPVQRRGR